MSKTDIVESTLDIVPIRKSEYLLVAFVWIETFYYDKCMGMGATSICKTLEQFSTALEWTACNKGHCRSIVHILDSFFVGPTHEEVALNLRIFKEVCTMIVIPLSTEKKFEPGTVMYFMRITVNAEHIEARLPQDKCSECCSC